MNAALPSGNVPEARLDGAGTALPEIWLAGGATGLAGYSSADGSQHLFIAGPDTSRAIPDLSPARTPRTFLRRAPALPD